MVFSKKVGEECARKHGPGTQLLPKRKENIFKGRLMKQELIDAVWTTIRVVESKLAQHCATCAQVCAGANTHCYLFRLFAVLLQKSTQSVETRDSTFSQLAHSANVSVRLAVARAVGVQGLPWCKRCCLLWQDRIGSGAVANAFATDGVLLVSEGERRGGHGLHVIQRDRRPCLPPTWMCFGM